MEAAFVDIGTPKNAVLYRGDVQYDPEDIVEKSGQPRIEQMLKAKQLIAVPGHEEPDRRQGRPAHPGGVAARPVRRADPQLEDVRHLQAAARRRAQAPAQHPRPGQAGRARTDRAHRRRERQRARAARRHDPAARSVERDRGQGEEGQQPDVAVPRARAGRAGDPRGVQRRVPRRHHRRPAAVRRGARLRRGVQPRARRPRRVLRRRGRGPAARTSATTSTSSCTRRSTARCGCRAAVR